MNSEIKHIIQTKDLAIGYKTKTSTFVVSEGINLSLNKGQLIGIVGANGIGKSTLLRTIATIQEPIDGTILINDTNVQSFTASSLAKTMSLVLTEQLMSKNLTVFELIALGRQPYTNWIGSLSEVDKQIIENAIRETNLTALSKRKCHELSDGQLQKVMIARALAQNTDLIILDEPTTHLDMYHKAYILKLLQRLTKTTNKTILFSSHEIDLAIQLCDTMIVMTKNSVVIDSPCKLIKNQVFNRLFPEDLIEFDQNSGSFRVKK